MATLLLLVNPLCAWLTLGSFVGYAFIYTAYLKHATPQNIVIGGLFGAMPPLLGWSAVSGTIAADALILVLIIFAWTPPHFWALAIHRKEEYAQSGVPMLPVTHGEHATKLHILAYTIILLAVSTLPFFSGLSPLALPARRPRSRPRFPVLGPAPATPPPTHHRHGHLPLLHPLPGPPVPGLAGRPLPGRGAGVRQSE